MVSRAHDGHKKGAHFFGVFYSEEMLALAFDCFQIVVCFRFL
jgi:hypothetical protein